MYKIIASDLDGTLLSPDNSLSPWAKDILKFLIAKGIHFIFATGRHYINVAQIRDNLGIKAYMITSNGARVHNENDQLIIAHNINQDVAVDLLKIAYNTPQIITNVYCDDKWLINRHYQNKKYLFKDTFLKYDIYTPNLMNLKGISKIFFICDNYNTLLFLEKKINSRWGELVNVSFSTSTCLEVMAGGVSKGDALSNVVNILGYNLGDCIVFGDGMNDSEMLSMAGKGCIMSNASQRLKDLHPELEIIGSNADDAVLHYLCKLYFSKY